MAADFWTKGGPAGDRPASNKRIDASREWNGHARRRVPLPPSIRQRVKELSYRFGTNRR